MADDHSRTMESKEQNAAPQNNCVKVEELSNPTQPMQQNAAPQDNCVKVEELSNPTQPIQQIQNDQATQGTPVKMPKKYQRRSGACDLVGPNLEIKMIGLLYLRALRNLRSSFYIAVNAAEAGGFDDVVIYFDKSGVIQELCIQLKHCSGSITKDALAAEKGTFSLNKHFNTVKDKCKAPNTHFILFSDAKISLDPATLKIDDPSIEPDFMQLVCTSGMFGKEVFSVDFENTVFDSIRELSHSKEFSQKLLFFSRQKKEESLNDLIRQEMIKLFHQVVPDTWVKEYLDMIMRYWDMKGKTLFLTETYTQWLNIRDNFCKRCQIPPNIIFNDQILSELSNMINNSNSQNIHIKCSGMSKTLRSLKVMQALLKSKDLQKFLYFTLDEDDNIKKQVLELWKDSYWKILLVDLGSSPSSLNLDEFISKRPDKKVILLSDCSTKTGSSGNWSDIELTVSLNQLNSASQNYILKETVSLQGVKITLGDLKVENLLRGEVLSSVLDASFRGLTIGDSLQQGEKNYIPRKLCKKILIKEKVSELDGVSDLFYIVGDGSEEYVRKINKERSSKNDTNRELDSNGNCIANRSEQTPKFKAVTELQLKDLTKTLRNTPNLADPIHVLNLEDKRVLYWRESYGDPSNLFGLIDCLDGELRDTEEFLRNCKVSKPKEKDFVACKLQNVIVTGEPGMGKSCLLISVARKLKELHPDSWVIQVKNLLETMKRLNKKNDFVFTKEGIVKILASEIQVEESTIQYRFLENAVQHVGNVYIICDGFDEICPTHSDLFLRFFKCIREETKVQALWVTSRHVVVERLENCLQTKAYFLEQFTETEIESYLHDTLESEQVKKIIEMINKNTSDGLNPVSSIPLHLMMIRELIVSKKYFTQGKFNLFELYNHFMKIKLDRYFGDTVKDSHVDIIETYKERIYGMWKICSLIALDILQELPEDERKSVLKDFEKEKPTIVGAKEKIGIIDGLSADGQPRFAHRTFAEFFAALWLAENMVTKNLKFIGKVTFDPEQNVLRAVLNQRLAEECPVHLAVLDNDESGLRQRLDKCKEVNSLDDGGRTPLHLACLSRGKTGTEMMKLLLNHDPKADVEIKDSLLKLTPLYYAVNSRSWDGVKLLLQHGANVEKNISDHPLVKKLKEIVNDDHASFDLNFDLKFELNWPIFNEKKTLLHLAAKSGYLNCIEMLLEEGADLEMRDEEGNTPLHDAVSSDKTKAALFLMEKKACINAVNNQGCTALHIALRRKRKVERDQGDEITEKLLQLGAKTCIKNEDGDTPLHDAVRYGNRFLVKLLLDKGANVNIENRYGNMPLHLVVSRWDFDHLRITELLLANHANTKVVNKDGDTPLHLAVQKNIQNMAKMLLENGSATETKNKLGDTPLHIAAREKKTDVRAKNRNLGIITSLLQYGAPVNEQNKSGNTPLQVAVRYGNSEAVDLLLEKKSSLHTKNKNGENALHEAVKERNSIDIVRKLLDGGAFVNDVTETGDTPLHIAAQYSNPEIVAFLLQRKAKLNAVNKCGNTPLHSAIEFRNRRERIDNDNRFKVISLLCREKADVSIVNNKGNTPLHIAVEKKILRVVKLLLNYPACKTIKNNNGETPMDIAKRLESREIESLILA